MDTEKHLGININLPSGTFHTLNQKRSQLLTLQNQSDDSSNGEQSIDASQLDEGKPQENGGISDEDRIIMPFSHISASDDDSVKSNEMEDSDVDEFDNISLSPPNSLPVLLLDLEKLCGYQPSDEEEVERITKEIREALLGTSSKNDFFEDATSLDFVTRSNELFDAGIAQHFTDVENDGIDIKIPLAIVNYPEFLPLWRKEEESSTLIPTRILWKKVIHSHIIQVVDRLLSLLSRCSRDLIWKYQMMLEIRGIAKEEIRKNEERLRNKQLRKWRIETRPAELAKLYDVRETFELRLHTSKEKHATFIKEREFRVQKELQRRAVSGRGTGGMAGLDWDADVTFGFGDDANVFVDKVLEERLHNTGEKEDDHDFADNECLLGVELDERKADTNSGSEQSSSGSNDMFQQRTPHHSNDSSLAVSLPVASTEDRVKRRAAAAARKKRKSTQHKKVKFLEKELRTKIMNAYAEEEAVRQMLISTDEKFALSTVLNLEKQLEKVDELLETLQEEEWKDEEDGLLDDVTSDCDSYNDSAVVYNDGDPSILDQILAMVLGTLPIASDTTIEEHYSFLKGEHESIINDWRTEFGMLPTLVDDSEAKPKKDHRSDNNFEESAWDDDEDTEEKNITAKVRKLCLAAPALPLDSSTTNFGPTSVPDDWEEGADLDDIFQQPTVQNEPPIATSSKIGLRPGGRTK
jgi:hypothetical protein